MRTRHIAFMLLDRMRGARMERHLRELEEAQGLDAEHLILWQREKLVALLAHARDTTDFYRTLIPKTLTPLSAPAALDALPVISRQLMRSQSERFVSRAFPQRELRLQHTSGSTGIPVSYTHQTLPTN